MISSTTQSQHPYVYKHYKSYLMEYESMLFITNHTFYIYVY